MNYILDIFYSVFAISLIELTQYIFDNKLSRCLQAIIGILTVILLLIKIINNFRKSRTQRIRKRQKDNVYKKFKRTG